MAWKQTCRRRFQQSGLLPTTTRHVKRSRGVGVRSAEISRREQQQKFWCGSGGIGPTGARILMPAIPGHRVPRVGRPQLQRRSPCREAGTGSRRSRTFYALRWRRDGGRTVFCLCCDWSPPHKLNRPPQEEVCAGSSPRRKGDAVSVDASAARRDWGPRWLARSARYSSHLPARRGQAYSWSCQ